MLSLRSSLVSILVALALVALSAATAAAACRGERSRNRAEAARAMFCLVNYERTRRGIPPVRYDARLARVARRHASHMVRFRFTGHNSPIAGGLVRRVKRAHVVSAHRRFWVGENLGWGSPALLIHQMWMRSAIHKKATLYRHFRRAGVGVVRGTPVGSRYRESTFVVTFAG